eukprot:TRINITY_DN2247_c0_g1_i2.p1 TRINITY_DN2247_c0_g1~~TRINITY_DN2247_c0_g1_i2.p1  ORF type:complete len:896 (+),score=191.18 TRINITY_DN2247_c0_g1_i2:182-2689(+)
MSAASVSSLLPMSGPSSGGTNITVTGANFVAANVYCSFGTITSILAVRISNTRVACLSPTQAAGTYAVEVSNNNIDYTTNGIPFLYQGDHTLTSIVPNTGPTAGGTVVTAVGTNFVSSSSLVCQFGTSTPVLATWISATLLQCTSPAGGNGTVSVAVSNNNQEYLGTGRPFTYQQTAFIQGVVPNAGPVVGGTVVTVTGLYFINGNMHCRFDSSRVAATVTNSSLVNGTLALCVAPSHAAGSVSFEVTNNNNDFTVSGLIFAYQADITLLAVAPPNGPLNGNSRVTVTGTNFLSSTSLRCRFGSVSVSATYVSATQSVCLSPVTASAGPVILEMTNNGQDFSNSLLQYRYLANINVTTVAPTSGPAKGGTVITLRGLNFDNNNLLSCRINSTVVTATWVSATVALCATPAVLSATYTVPVAISNNNQDFTKCTLYKYRPTETVGSVTPVFGGDIGGTFVQVFGTNFANDGGPLCRFGIATSPAIFVSATEFNCLAPANPVGFLAVEVANNGADFTNNNLQFQYTILPATPTVLSLSPTLGPNDGGTLVTVIGTGYLLGSTYCRFGVTAPVLSTYVTSSVVNCMSPPQSPGSVAVDVSVNGTNFFLQQPSTHYYATMPRTTLYVGNLNPCTPTEDLDYEFGRYGRIRRISVRGPSSRPFAFVEYDYETDAEDAYDDMDGVRIDGNRLRIEWARESRGRSYHRSRYSRSRSPSRSRSRSRSRSYSPSYRRRSVSRSPSRSRSPRRSSRRSRSPRKHSPVPTNTHVADQQPVAVAVAADEKRTSESPVAPLDAAASPTDIARSTGVDAASESGVGLKGDAVSNAAQNPAQDAVTAVSA